MRELVVVPYGVGIGDFVNMRPIIAGVKRARPDHVIHVIAPLELQWLLPSGVKPLTNIPGLEHWPRASPASRVGALSAHMSIRSTSWLERLLLRRRLSAWLGTYLRYQGFSEVVNCLEDFAQFDLDTRWTVGQWSRAREHVIDLLCGILGARGIKIEPADRFPTLSSGESMREGDYAVVNPAAGMRLKEPREAVWADVASGLLSRGTPVRLVRTPDRPIGEHIHSTAPGTQLLPSMSLPALINVVAAARLLVSPDTGLLHLAAAIGTPFVGLFGPTDPLFLGPYDRRLGICVEAAITRPPVCRRCWTGQLLPETRCAVFDQGSCSDLIGTHEVLDAARSVLARAFDSDPMRK